MHLDFEQVGVGQTISCPAGQFIDNGICTPLPAVWKVTGVGAAVGAIGVGIVGALVGLIGGHPGYGVMIGGGIGALGGGLVAYEGAKTIQQVGQQV